MRIIQSKVLKHYKQLGIYMEMPIGISIVLEKRFWKMDNIEYILQQSKELARAADDISELRGYVRRYQELVKDAWKSSEIKGLEDAADRLYKMMYLISEELSDISHDLLISADDLEN